MTKHSSVVDVSNLTQVWLILVLGIVCGMISLTVTSAKIFLPFRTFVKARSTWWGDLITCPYCFGHWVSAGLTLLFKPKLINWQWDSSPFVYWMTTGIELVVVYSVSLLLIVFVSSISAGIVKKILKD